MTLKKRQPKGKNYKKVSFGGLIGYSPRKLRIRDLIKPVQAPSEQLILKDHEVTVRDTGNLPNGEREDLTEGTNAFPRIAWGQREEKGRSKLGWAEREVEIWQEIRRSHNEGGLKRLVPLIEAKIDEAKQIVDTIKAEGKPEDFIVGVKNPAALAIKQRLESLEWALSTSKFKPEKENIRGAIAGYKSGVISYTNVYTLIYAGKVVDTAPDYASFVRDRQTRLDRYFEIHGEHWLWYEPPLVIHPNDRPKMMKTCNLIRDPASDGLGHYCIIQGFWKRAGWVMRMKGMRNLPLTDRDASFERLDDGRVNCQIDGPQLCFSSLLDSGATVPSLFQEDLARLMINPETYGCQSVSLAQTSNGAINLRLFEMFVCVMDELGQNIVDPLDAMWPNEPKYVGSLCPVCVYQPPTENSLDGEGREVQQRLSGMFPFLACYMSSTPTENMMYFAENRRGVLGIARMPGQKRWNISDSIVPNPQTGKFMEAAGEPVTTFYHNGGQIIDQDDPVEKHASTIVLHRGMGPPNEHHIRSDPKKQAKDDRRNSLLAKVNKIGAEIQMETDQIRAAGLLAAQQAAEAGRIPHEEPVNEEGHPPQAHWEAPKDANVQGQPASLGRGRAGPPPTMKPSPNISPKDPNKK